MPELPEVETVRRTIAPALQGRVVREARFLWHRTCVGDVRDTEEALSGQRIDRIDRRGKYLIFRLRRQGIDSVLVIHLRMTGNLLLGVERDSYTRAELELDDGRTLRFRDVRKFGKWQWSPEMPARLDRLGPEPLEIDPSEFAVRLRARRKRLKTLLLDQEFLGGLGNIYADEALFRARLHPTRKATTVSRVKARALHAAVQDVLREALAAGGSSISSFVDGQGSKGYFQLAVKVYGKTGKPCESCGTPVRRIVVGQRSTHYCPRCQRR